MLKSVTEPHFSKIQNFGPFGSFSAKYYIYLSERCVGRRPWPKADCKAVRERDHFNRKCFLQIFVPFVISNNNNTAGSSTEHVKCEIRKLLFQETLNFTTLHFGVTCAFFLYHFHNIGIFLSFRQIFVSPSI